MADDRPIKPGKDIGGGPSRDQHDPSLIASDPDSARPSQGPPSRATVRSAKQKDRMVLLSELYQQGQGPLAPSVVEVYHNKVSSIVSKEHRTEEKESFVRDFLSCIVDLKVSQALAPESEHRSVQKDTATLSRANDQGNEVHTLALTAVSAPSGAAQIVKANELVVVPEKFDGNRLEACKWLDSYERSATSNSWNPATMTKYLQTYLAGPALDWYAVMVQSSDIDPSSWPVVRSRFCRLYIGKDEDLELEPSIKDALQEPHESSVLDIMVSTTARP